MTQIAVAAAGTGAEVNANTSLAVPYPASIAEGDLLILVKNGGTHSMGHQTPAGGWARHPGVPADVNIGTVDTIGAACIAVFYKWAVGDETGNLTVTCTSAANHHAARMFRCNGFTATGEDPFVGSATNSGTDASMESPATAAAATSDNDMGLLIAVIADDNATGNWDEASESVEWTESVAEFLHGLGNDGAITINHCATVTDGNVIPANLETMAASDPWWILTCIVKEAAGVSALTLELGKVPSEGAVRGVDLVPGLAPLAAGKVASAELVRGVTLDPVTVALPVGKVAASEDVHGLDLAGSGAAALLAGAVPSGEVVRGGDLTGSGSAALAAGKVPSEEAVQGVTLDPTSVALPVAKVASPEEVRGIDVVSLQGALQLGKIGSGELVRGADLDPAGVAPLPVARVPSAEAVRGADAVASGAAPLLPMKVSSGEVVRGVDLLGGAIVLTPGKIPTGATVRGVNLVPAPVILQAGKVPSPELVRGLMLRLPGPFAFEGTPSSVDADANAHAPGTDDHSGSESFDLVGAAS